MNQYIQFPLQKSERRWELSKVDRTFTFWSLIWFAYFSLFVAFASAQYAALVAIIVFFGLWYRFCKSLELLS